MTVIYLQYLTFYLYFLKILYGTISAGKTQYLHKICFIMSLLLLYLGKFCQKTRLERLQPMQYSQSKESVNKPIMPSL